MPLDRIYTLVPFQVNDPDQMAKAHGVVAAALGSLCDLYEEELADAVEKQDLDRVKKLAWEYGLYTATMMSLEMGRDHCASEATPS